MAQPTYKFSWQKIPAENYTITKISDDEYEVEFGEGEVQVTLKALEGELENV